MGLFDKFFGDQKTLTRDGFIYVREKSFGNQTDAEGWKKHYEQYGYKAFIQPNSQEQCFDLYIARAEDPRKETVQ